MTRDLDARGDPGTFPLKMVFTGIVKLVVASSLMFTAVFAISLSSLNNDTGKVSIGLPWFFKRTVSSKFSTVVFEM